MENLNLKQGKRYKVTWKGVYGNLHNYYGIYKKEENNELIFDIDDIGELPFTKKEIKNIEKTTYIDKERIQEEKKKSWLDTLKL